MDWAAILQALLIMIPSFLLAGGFSTPSAISFASAFLLVCVGITMFSLTGYSYKKLPAEEPEVSGEGQTMHTVFGGAVKESPRTYKSISMYLDQRERNAEDGSLCYDREHLADQQCSDRRQNSLTVQT